MDLLQRRENAIFETLEKIKNERFVVIGGYAVNAYTLPRFSIDCDIVIENSEHLKSIEHKLIEFGYKKNKNIRGTLPYHGHFMRYEKVIISNFKVSIDILIKNIIDRQTNTTFSAEWVFENSQVRELKGKTITKILKLKIINPEALVVMKCISCRTTDIRDVFMILPSVKNKEWIKREITTYYDFSDRFEKIKKKISSKAFKDNLQGVFGYVDEKTFDKHKKTILELEK